MMKDLRYTLGLDIGIASVGWAVLQNDINGEPFKIERLGVRIFEQAENPKDGSSLAAPRREARGARRVVRRRKHRKDRIKLLMEQTGIISHSDLDALFQSGSFEQSVYELRVEALDRPLNNEETARLLIHFAQRRGYKSNSRAQEAADAKESGQVKTAISANRSRMAELQCRTVGELLWKDERFRRVNPDGSVTFVPHNAPEDYKTTVERSMLEEEIRLIFQRQRDFGSQWANAAFEEQYLEIWGSQRNFDEGPGFAPDGKSKYGGSQIERMLGKCTFEKEKPEPRAPKACYTAEYFRVLQEANHLKLLSKGMPGEFLDEEQRKAFIDFQLDRQSTCTLLHTLDLPYVLSLLKAWRADQADKCISLWVFNQDETPEDPMHPQSPTGYLAKFAKRYDIPDLHPHKLRHSFASVAITHGADVASVSEKLGHADKAVTLRMYTHADEQSIKRAGDIFREAVENG